MNFRKDNEFQPRTDASSEAFEGGENSGEEVFSKSGSFLSCSDLEGLLDCGREM
jgi:hypothetical protein